MDQIAFRDSWSGERRHMVFIVVEGLDKAGKTTFCAALVARLRSEGVAVLDARFPVRHTAATPSITGALVRDMLAGHAAVPLEVAHLVFSANRWEHVAQIKSALAGGAVVVCDRYTFSGAAYSLAHGLGRAWCEAADHGLPVPDVVVYLDVDPALAKGRAAYGAETIERVEFQEKVHAAYEQLWTAPTVGVVYELIRIDASKPPDAVLAHALGQLSPFLRNIQQ